MTTDNNNTFFVWIDLEMTGLDIQKNYILEIALQITTPTLVPIGQERQWIIHQPENIIIAMESWPLNQHTKTGLLEKVRLSETTIESVDAEIETILNQYKDKRFLLAGNSVWQDRLFINKFMPLFSKKLHYRIIDVSSLKEIIQLWYPTHPEAFFIKKNTHRALDDIEESINEVTHYKKKFFIKL